jgi:6-pyruvoyltetrahydropterin/6-carboxytetrahydropterin synthase
MRTHGAFKVTVTKDYIGFASAHFITFAGHRCEALHGHNYRAEVTLEGAIDERSWFVIDFSDVKKMMKRLCDEIDHKVLLPLENPKLAITERDGAVHVAYEGTPRYMFPRSDCALLPIPNTTVEMLARHLTGRVLAELEAMQVTHLTAIELELEESLGQSAVYRELLG